MFTIGGFDLTPTLARIDRWPVEDRVNRFWSDWCSWCAPAVWRTAFWAPSAPLQEAALSAAAALTRDWYRRAARQAIADAFEAEENPKLWQRAASVEGALARGIAND